MNPSVCDKDFGKSMEPPTALLACPAFPVQCVQEFIVHTSITTSSSRLELIHVLGGGGS